MTVYSHSRLNTFETCPRKYAFHYVEKTEIDPKPDTVEAFLGKRVHETLEKLYQDAGNGLTPSLPDVLAYYERLWRENWNSGVKIVRPHYGEHAYFQNGLRMLSAFYRKNHPFNQATTLGLERRVELTLSNGSKLHGYIDRISKRKDGTVEIHDYKTSGHLPTQAEVDESRQLALYQLAVSRTWPSFKKFELVWHYLKFDEVLVNKRSPKTLNQLEKDVESLIEEIELLERKEEKRVAKLGGSTAKPANQSTPHAPTTDTNAMHAESSLFKPVKSALCDWCEFKAICPLWKHQFTLELINEKPELSGKEAAALYGKDAGVKLVDKFADIKHQIADLEQQESNLKEALIDYARQNGLQVVVGKDKRVKINFAIVGKWPKKGSDERKELEALLKKGGVWLDVSELDTALLKRLLEGEGDGAQLPKQLKGKVEAYLKEEEQVGIFLSTSER